MTGKADMMISRNVRTWKRQQICCLDRRQSVMDNTTSKVSCFARAYRFENNNTHIFADSMAKKILGDDFNQIAKSMVLFSTKNIL